MAVKFLNGIDVGGSMNITANDIPDHSARKITSDTLDAARIPDLSGTYQPVGNYLTSIPSEYLTQTEGDARYLQSLPSHNHNTLYDAIGSAEAVQTFVNEQNFATDAAISTAVSNYLPLSGGTLSGNLTVGAVGKTSDTVVRSLADQSYKAGFEAYGNGQGTGYVYVGQSLDYGGGFSYNGDNSPGFIGGETADNITFFRRQAGTNTEVFHYAYSNNDVYFNGAVVASGSNSNNWNTAYGWGNHASAGYLTSIPSSYATDAEVNSAVSVVNDRIDTEILPSIPTNNNQLTNGAGYITDGNTGWNNSYGFITSTVTSSLTIAGSETRGTYTSLSQYHSGADNLVLKGNSVGISSIFFESEKDGTNINHPSDFGFIQYHAYGTSTSGESNELIIGVSNDADDHVILNAPNVNGLKFRVGVSATDYNVYHSGNLSLSTLGYTGATNANYITNNNQLTNGAGYATTSYVNTAVSNLVASAPAALNTLNELAAALGDDANFSTTVTNNIGAVNTRIDEEVLPAIDAKQNAGNYATFSYITLNDSTTTASFIAELTTEHGAFQDNYRAYKVGWSYAGNSNLDVGFESVELAGCLIECFGGTYKHVRLTRPTTGTGGRSIYVYNDQGSSYAPGWRQIWTSDEFSSTNVSNWNTAYGWGNHASAGYLTSIPSTYATDAEVSTAVATVDTRIDNEVLPVLDGKLDATAKAADSDLLDGINSTSFLRSDQADTMSGTLTITGSSGVSRLRIEGTTPTIDLDDADGDSFYIHVNSNNFYVLTDRDGGGDYGTWEGSHPMQLEADTNSAYFFGNKLNSAAYQASSAFDAAGSADAVQTWVGEQNFATDAAINTAIGTVTLASLGYTGATNANYITNNNQLTNGAGYLTSSNDRNYITDSRGAARAPSYYNDRYAQWDFQNVGDTGVGGDGWHALLTVSKWSSFDPSHRQEQLIFSGDHLWRRTAESDADWGDNKKIWDSGNLDAFVGATVSNDTITFTTANGGTVAVTTSDANTNTWRPIDDTPVNGVTTESISSNWAYDHVNASNPHGTTAADVGADPVGSAEAVQTWVGEQNYASDAAINTAIATVTLSSLGYTGATNANYITNNNQLTNGAGYITSADGGNANLLDGLDLHTGRNNQANKVVRSNGSGYVDFGWINTTSGNTTSTLTDIYVNTNDGYIRKATPAHFRSQITDGVYDPVGSASAVSTALSEEIGNLSTAVSANTTDVATNRTSITTNATNISALSTSISTGSVTIGSGVTLSESTDRADLLMIKSSTSTWGGLQVSNTSNEIIFSLMGDGTTGGIYDDQNSDWLIQWTENAGVRLYHNAGQKLTTTSTGVSITGALVASGDVTAFSDARVKENVETLPNALESVKQMRGVTYNKIGEEKQSVGVIAQELEEVVPQLVHTDEEGMKSVAYGNITAVLIEALKEQQAQIEELKSRLDGLTK